MQWIEIIINILLSILSGIIYSALIVAVIFLAYKTKVKGYSFNRWLPILKSVNGRIEKKSHKDQVNACMERYHTLVKRPSFIKLIIPLVIVGIIGYILYTQMVFFAVVSSGSMEPTFKKNDLILMQNISTEVDTGDIIMFKAPNVITPVTHRIIDESGNGIITKGDARRSRDDWVVQHDLIMGKAISINDKPIIIKDVGMYFIEELSSEVITPRYGEELIFMRNLIATIKSLGLVIFFIAIFMYILSSIKS